MDRKPGDAARHPAFILLLLGVAVIGVLFAGVASPAPYLYDESDYMYAGSQGFWANFMDQNALSSVEFVTKGLELSRNKESRVSMSQYIRSSGDISFYRHYHGPVYAYWIALCRSIGVRHEAGYRASGLVMHGLGAIGIYFLFALAFPDYFTWSAFIAALMFAGNRTALVTATTITQHVAFEVFAVLSLLTLAIYFRSGLTRWWYVTAGLLAFGFASVEISAVLLVAVVLSVIIVRINDGWRAIAGLLGKGMFCFLAVCAIVWPKGIFTLNALKGYMYLAYMSLNRKTFSPIGPGELWGFRLRTYPYEFWTAAAVLIMTAVVIRGIPRRARVVPILLYSVMFLGVTMVVTLPYTHYNGSLLAAIAVLAGVVVGEVNRRWGFTPGFAAGAAVIVSVCWMDVAYYTEARRERTADSLTADVLRYLDVSPPAAGERIYMPFALVPALHFYRPDILTEGYDADWSSQRLADSAITSTPSRVLCANRQCAEVLADLPPGGAEMGPEVSKRTDSGESLLALRLQP